MMHRIGRFFIFYLFSVQLFDLFPPSLKTKISTQAVSRSDRNFCPLGETVEILVKVIQHIDFFSVNS